MTTDKCMKCSEKFTVVLKHKIYVRLYDKVKGKTLHRYVSIGKLCPKCLNVELDKITP